MVFFTDQAPRGLFQDLKKEHIFAEWFERKKRVIKSNLSQRSLTTTEALIVLHGTAYVSFCTQKRGFSRNYTGNSGLGLKLQRSL